MRTNLVADASSSAEPLMQHVNAAGETVATAGGDGGGPDGGPCAPANVGTCDPKYWSCPGAAGYKVRGQTYLKVRPSYSSLAPGPPPLPMSSKPPPHMRPCLQPLLTLLPGSQDTNCLAWSMLFIAFAWFC